MKQIVHRKSAMALFWRGWKSWLQKCSIKFLDFWRRHHLTSNTKRFHLPLSSVESFLCGHCFGEIQNQFRIQYFSPYVKIKSWEFCKYFTQTIHHEAILWWIEVWRSMIEIWFNKERKKNLHKNFNWILDNFDNSRENHLKVFFSDFSLI